MTRILCEQCQRPNLGCICRFIGEVKNSTAVLVLQHPSEVTQTKGTVALLSRSLSQCQVLVGENFSQHHELNRLLTKHQALLLYPSAQAQVLTNNTLNSADVSHTEETRPPTLLIILDGTWKKAYRMFMLSSNLQALKQVCLPDSLADRGQYLIRKVAKKNALSSLEACCYALALLEGEITEGEILEADIGENQLADKKLNKIERPVDFGIYQNVLNNFTAFNQFQLSFRSST